MTRPGKYRGTAGARAAAAGLAAALALTAPEPAAAEEAPAFSFKRVTAGAPPAGGRRITVQIDPDTQARILAANPAVPPRPEQPFDPGAAAGADGAPPAAAGGTYRWYWDHVSPARAAASSGRLDAAVAATRRGPGGTGVTARACSRRRRGAACRRRSRSR